MRISARSRSCTPTRAGYDDLVREVVRPPRSRRHTAGAGAQRSGRPARRRRSRTVILQFWRNIGPAKMDFPLAFCDARTVTPNDCRPIPVSDYAGSGVDFEALAVLAPNEPEQSGGTRSPSWRSTRSSRSARTTQRSSSEARPGSRRTPRFTRPRCARWSPGAVRASSFERSACTLVGREPRLFGVFRDAPSTEGVAR